MTETLERGSYFSRNASAESARKSGSASLSVSWSQSHQARSCRRCAVWGAWRHLITLAGVPATIVIEAVAPTQELADTVVALARATSLHQSFAGRKTTAGNLAFPFSPSDLQGGPVYEFAIYHLLETADPDSIFRIEMREL